LAADGKYKGKVNFVLCNMGSLADVDKFVKSQGLSSDGNLIHGFGKPPGDYGIKYIPHKVLIGKDGNVVKNFTMSLPDDLDALLE